MKALTLENGVSHAIMFGLSAFTVLTAIDLNGQPSAETDEIQKITSKRSLAAKMISVSAECAQPQP